MQQQPCRLPETLDNLASQPPACCSAAAAFCWLPNHLNIECAKRCCPDWTSPAACHCCSPCSLTCCAVDSRVGSHQASQLPLQCCQQPPARVKEALGLVNLQCAALMVVQLLQRCSICHLCHSRTRHTKHSRTWWRGEGGAVCCWPQTVNGTAWTSTTWWWSQHAWTMPDHACNSCSCPQLAAADRHLQQCATPESGPACHTMFPFSLPLVSSSNVSVVC